MDPEQAFERRRLLRGAPYSLEEFRSRYRLAAGEAETLYRRFGPSSVELDLLMAAKIERPSFDRLVGDLIP